MSDCSIHVLYMQCRAQCRTSRGGCLYPPENIGPWCICDANVMYAAPYSFGDAFAIVSALATSANVNVQARYTPYVIHVSFFTAYLSFLLSERCRVRAGSLLQSTVFPKCNILNDTFPCLSSWPVITPCRNCDAKGCWLFLERVLKVLNHNPEVSDWHLEICWMAK